MPKPALEKPILIYLYGLPGSGKTYVARNISTEFGMAHVSADRIRSELFAKPRYDDRENAVVMHLMRYMTEEFLNAGVGVVYDINTAKPGHRRALRELARKNKAHSLLVWIQVDPETAFARTQDRDRRTSDDRYAQDHTQSSFNQIATAMEPPQDEDCLVISGKHSFSTQKNVIANRLFQEGVISAENVRSSVAKPELINLIPTPFISSDDKRNISIHE